MNIYDKKSEMKPVLIIAPNPKIFALAEQTASEQGRVQVVSGLLEEAVPIARNAITEGVQVVVSRGGTTRLLESGGLNIPVVDIAVSPYNMLVAIHKAKNFGQKITVMGSIQLIRGVEKLRRILDVDLEIHEISNRSEAEIYVMNRMRSHDPIRVLLGGAIAESLAENYDLPTAFLETGRGDIATALEEAFRLVEVQQREARKTEQIKAILDNINHGVIGTTNKGIITTFNRAAGKLTGIAPDFAEGRQLFEVMPRDKTDDAVLSGLPRLGDLVRIGKTMVLSNKVPVKLGDEIVGVVQTLEDVTRIRDYENTIRIKLTEKGHLAHNSFNNIIGKSATLSQTIQLAKKYAAVDSVIFIEGESGTGKEIFAQAIHTGSGRCNGPFVAVNCGAIPDSLLESELFGYSAGAFSGARQEGKDGLFALAHTGTLFLDEITETSQNFQTILLRVIQQMEIRPLGSDRVIPIDVRIIAATNRSLKQEVSRGKFRRDLYYRLNILRLNIPPLRYRKEDIPLLLEHFLRYFSVTLSKKVSLEKRAIAALQDYDWPGNVRELQNVIERLCVTCDQKIDYHLAEKALADCIIDEQENSDRAESIRTHHILDVLKQCGGNKKMAAERLGISRTTLWRELKTIRKT